MRWAIFSPSLLAYPFSKGYVQDEEHKESILAMLSDLDKRPGAVDEHFNGLRHMPMGKYFEQLLFFILEKDE